MHEQFIRNSFVGLSYPYQMNKFSNDDSDKTAWKAIAFNNGNQAKTNKNVNREMFQYKYINLIKGF